MGTVTLLQELGHEAVVIDYTSPPHRFSLVQTLKNWKLWFHLPTVFELAGRQQAFQRAQVHFKRTGKLLTYEELEKEQFDAVLIGADVVWDYATPYLGQDPVYFGAHLAARKKISFAASCGKVPADNEPPAYVIEGLRKLDGLSVRDANTQRMVKKYTGRDAVMICDPAFHLEVDSWAVAPKGLSPYLLVYAMPDYISDDLIAQTRAYARRHGLKTIAVCYRQTWTDENRICIGPLEWLGYVRNAAAVVTNTFHGTVFSVKAGVPFVSELNDSIRLKTVSMIEKLRIEDRFFSSGKSVEEILRRTWDVEGVHKRIEAWSGEARAFLSKALNG
jgi:polysaccharide pyruvyl transferase WcaK-like protein